MDKKLQIRAIAEKVEGKLMAVASEEIADRDGDILTIDGWELKNFKQNPVLLYYHIMTNRTLPIGRAKGIAVKEINGKKKLVFTPEFETITEEGKILQQFYDEGWMKAFSVGFMPIEATKISQDGEWPPRYKYTKQELLEISAVPIPALPTATIIDGAKNLGMNVMTVKSFLKDVMGQKLEDANTPEESADEIKPENQPDVTDSATPVEDEENEEAPNGDVSENGDSDIQIDNEDKDNTPPVDSTEEKLAKLENMMKHLIGEVQSLKKTVKSSPKELEASDEDVTMALNIITMAVSNAVNKSRKGVK